MTIFDEARREMNELVRLVRQSERYLTSIAHKPELASAESHAAEIKREHQIADLSARLGVTS